MIKVLKSSPSICVCPFLSTFFCLLSSMSTIIIYLHLYVCVILLFVLCMFPSLRPERKAKNSVEVGNHNASEQVLYNMWHHSAESRIEKPCDRLTDDLLSSSTSSPPVVVSIQRYYKHGVPEAPLLVSVDRREKAEQQRWFWEVSNDRQAWSATVMSPGHQKCKRPLLCYKRRQVNETWKLRALQDQISRMRLEIHCC